MNIGETNSMKYSLWEVSSGSAGQKFLYLLWNLYICYSVQNSSLVCYVLNLINSFYTLCPGLWSDLSPLNFLTEILYAFITSAMLIFYCLDHSKESVWVQIPVYYFVTFSVWWACVSLLPRTRARGTTLVGCPVMLIQYTHLHLMMRLRMHIAATPPFLHIFFLEMCLIKHGHNFTLTHLCRINNVWVKNTHMNEAILS